MRTYRVGFDHPYGGGYFKLVEASSASEACSKSGYTCINCVHVCMGKNEQGQEIWSPVLSGWVPKVC